MVSGVGVICVGMYLRTTQRRRKDGSLVRYLQLAHNRRAGAVTRAEVLLNLGREAELDVDGLRRLAPCSKLAAAEWVSQDAAIPGLETMDDDQAYRALDLLVEADAEAKVQEAVFFACADLLNLEVDLLFFDTTSTYFEAEPDGPGE